VPYESYEDLIEKNKNLVFDNRVEFDSIVNDLMSQEKYYWGYPTYRGAQEGIPQKREQMKYPDGSWVTWCNQFAFDLVELLGYKINLCYHLNGKLWTSPQTFSDLAASRAAGLGTGVRKFTLEQAVGFAQYSIPVVAVDRLGYGHMAVFHPSSTIEKPMLVQAGAPQTMGIHSLYDSFTKWSLDPKFYYFDKKEF
jgi:hypothetical protein